MKVLIWVTLIFAILYSPVLADKDEDGSETLTELNFDQFISNNKYVLVNFHALWCRYSKKLKPEWKKVVEALGNNNGQVKIAKVEAYDEKKLAEKYDIEGYPTIKFFIDKKAYDYTGERNSDHILEFVNRMTKAELTEAKDVQFVTNKQKEYEWILITTESNSAVKDTAFKNQDVLFLRTSNSDVKSKYGLSDAKIVLVNQIDGEEYAFKEDSVTADNLNDFIQEHKFPKVAKFSKGTAERIFLDEKPSMILITKGSSSDSEKNFKGAYDAVQKEGKIFMAYAHFEDEIGKLLTENLGLKESNLPAVIIVKSDKEKIRKWRSTAKSPADSDNVVDFYKSWKAKDGKVALRYYLSEPKPTEQKDLVTKVVGENWKEMVEDATHDVLVLFWAPWCGHCRAMMPVYDNVARKTKPVENFRVAKVDVSVNELEGFGIDIVEYPTILLFTTKDKKNPIEFKGERNEFVFNDFIRAHATVNLDRMKAPNPFDKNEL